MRVSVNSVVLLVSASEDFPPQILKMNRPFLEQIVSSLHLLIVNASSFFTSQDCVFFYNGLYVM